MGSDALPASLRETGGGGLAATPHGQKNRGTDVGRAGGAHNKRFCPGKNLGARRNSLPPRKFRARGPHGTHGSMGSDALPASLRETGGGGLAATPTGRRIAESM